MNTLTQYGRPRPAYVPKDQGWKPLGGWHQADDGTWRRVYAKGRGRRTRTARRAVVRSLGAMRWVWEVEQFDCTTRCRTVIARGTREKLSAAAAWPFADLAARS